MIRLRLILVMLLQLAGLMALNLVGRWIAHALRLPVPGNVVGMVILFVLLLTRLVRLEWIDATATVFNRHLAFFFIPIAVGLLGYGSVIRTDGAAMILIAIITVTAGIAATGAVVTWCQRTSQRDP